MLRTVAGNALIARLLSGVCTLTMPPVRQDAAPNRADALCALWHDDSVTLPPVPPAAVDLARLTSEIISLANSKPEFPAHDVLQALVRNFGVKGAEAILIEALPAIQSLDSLTIARNLAEAWCKEYPSAPWAESLVLGKAMGTCNPRVELRKSGCSEKSEPWMNLIYGLAPEYAQRMGVSSLSVVVEAQDSTDHQMRIFELGLDPTNGEHFLRTPIESSMEKIGNHRMQTITFLTTFASYDENYDVLAEVEQRISWCYEKDENLTGGTWTVIPQATPQEQGASAKIPGTFKPQIEIITRQGSETRAPLNEVWINVEYGPSPQAEKEGVSFFVAKMRVEDEGGKVLFQGEFGVNPSAEGIDSFLSPLMQTVAATDISTRELIFQSTVTYKHGENLRGPIRLASAWKWDPDNETLAPRRSISPAAQCVCAGIEGLDRAIRVKNRQEEENAQALNRANETLFGRLLSLAIQEWQGDAYPNVLNELDLDAHWTLLDFTAGWCPNCLAGLPDLSALQTQLQGRGYTNFRVVSLVGPREQDMLVNQAPLDQWLSEQPAIEHAFGQLADKELELFLAAGRLPLFVLVDEEGSVTDVSLGSPPTAQYIIECIRERELPQISPLSP